MRVFWLTVALLAGAAVLALFFVHLAAGSFSSTHGPVSALRSMQFLQLFFLCIAAVAQRLVPPAKAFAGVTLAASPDFEQGLASSFGVLRC